MNTQAYLHPLAILNLFEIKIHVDIKHISIFYFKLPTNKNDYQQFKIMSSLQRIIFCTVIFKY